MRDPDTALFNKWQELMVTGDMTGMNRPVGRITVGKNKVRGHISTSKPGTWREDLFDQPRQVELGFVKSIDIQRSTDQDAATCTIVVYNDQMMPGAYAPQGIDTGIGRPGYRSPTRGETPAITGSTYELISGDSGRFPTSWNYPYPEGEPGDGLWTWTNPITGQQSYGFRIYDGGTGEFGGASAEHNRALLIPNRVIRTFQGYGSDNFDENGEHYPAGHPEYVHPADDAQLVQTGIWMVDRVVFGVDGFITLECRDLAKLLLEQFVYPDMVPIERFPLIYCPRMEWTESETRNVAAQVGSNVITGLGAPSGQYSSSNDVHYGHNASVFGHRPSHAFDGKLDTYFLSVGNISPTVSFAYEYVTGNAGGNKVNQVIVNTVKTGYWCYVGIYENGSWQGTGTVPYEDFPDYPNRANVKFVKRYTITEGGDNILTLPRTYNAQFVRVTFYKLQNFTSSGYLPYPYRVGVRKLQARYRKPATTETVTTTHNNFNDPGVIVDWSEAVRELLGWGGFTWPAKASAFPGVQADPLLGTARGGYPLRIWGDIEWLGAGPIVCTKPEYFVNKSFMESLNQIVNMIGAIFFVDEAGGAVFRMPNIFSAGNFNTGAPELDTFYGDMRVDGRQFQYYMHHRWPIEFHENANLVNYQVALDDTSVRSEILVVGEHPDTSSNDVVAGGYVLGENPVTGNTSAVNFDEVLAGQTRLFLVPGDDTKNFSTIAECQRMAELTALKILFTYRSGQVTSPCHPGLQIDDQVRIFERITHEFNVHYVSGISTRMDLDAGEWTMEVTTHWLGSDPRQGPGLIGSDFDNWFLNQFELTPAVRNLPAIEQRLADTKIY